MQTFILTNRDWWVKDQIWYFVIYVNCLNGWVLLLNNSFSLHEFNSPNALIPCFVNNAFNAILHCKRHYIRWSSRWLTIWTALEWCILLLDFLLFMRRLWGIYSRLWFGSHQWSFVNVFMKWLRWMFSFLKFVSWCWLILSILLLGFLHRNFEILSYWLLDLPKYHFVCIFSVPLFEFIIKHY